MLAAMSLAGGLTELILILVIALVVFSATKLPLSGARTNAGPSQPSRWTSADWLLLAVTILAVSVAVALEIWKARAS
jgi:mttA/Hcf106 family protein